MVTVEKLRQILGWYDEGILTEGEVSARVGDEVVSEWVEATKNGDGLMTIRSHCGSGPSPDPIYLRLTWRYGVEHISRENTLGDLQGVYLYQGVKAALGSVRSYAETCANVAEMCKKSHEAEEWKRVAEGLSKLAESCPER